MTSLDTDQGRRILRVARTPIQQGFQHRPRSRPPRLTDLRWVMISSSLLVALWLAPVVKGATTSRTRLPVVVTGSLLPDFISSGTPIDRLAVFRWDPATTTFVEIPFQIDEVGNVKLTNRCDQMCSRYCADPMNPYLRNCENGYTMPHPAGSEDDDLDGVLSAFDEIAFMARDAGPRVSSQRARVPDTVEERYEIVITDPNDPNNAADNTDDYVYIFKFNSSHTPAYPYPYYVDWDCLSPTDQYACVPARNAEYQPAKTCFGSAYNSPCRKFIPSSPDSLIHGGLPVYETRFAGTWINNGLQIKVGANALGPNILDRVKMRLLRGNFETEETWSSDACNVLLGQKIGPIRAIRYVMGTQSGLTTTSVVRFYDTYVDWVVKLRVHALVYDLRYHPDYYWDGGDLRFYSTQAGATSARDIVDGQGQYALDDQFSDWTQVSGPAGSGKGGVAQILLMPRPIPGSSPSATYDDDGTLALDPPESQDGTYGDFVRSFGHQSYGGMVDRQCVPNNDPNGPNGSLLCYAELHAGTYMLPDDSAPTSNAIEFQKWEENPFQISAIAEMPGPIPPPPPPPACVPTFTLDEAPTGNLDQGRFSQISDVRGCPGVAGFHVYKAEGTGPFGFLADLKGRTLYQDFRVKVGTTFRYEIRAYNWMNVEGPASTIQQITVHDHTPPQRPTGLHGSPGDRSVKLDWSIPDDACQVLPATNVYMSQNSGGPWTKLNSMSAGRSTFTETSLTNGQTYYFVLTAVDASGNESDYSNEVALRPMRRPPSGKPPHKS